MNKSQTTYCLDMGDLGEQETEVTFNWYKAPMQKEDDYDELEIESVVITLNGIKIDVVDMLDKTAVEYITEHCWESIGE